MAQFTVLSRTNAFVILVTVASISLPACVSYDKSGAAVIAQWDARFGPGAVNQQTSPWTGISDRMTVRDFVFEGVAVKDYEYKKYVDLLRRGTSWSGFGAATAVQALTTAGTLTTGGTTQTLSGIAGAINGTSSAFSKHILFDQSITTFVGRMDALRTKKLEEIKLRLKESDYSYAEAYRDVQDYGRLGSLDAALSDVAKKSGVEEAVAKKEVELSTGSGH